MKGLIITSRQANINYPISVLFMDIFSMSFMLGKKGIPYSEHEDPAFVRHEKLYLDLGACGTLKLCGCKEPVKAP